MEKLIEEIEEEMDGLTEELASCTKVKAAAARARKHTGNLGRLFKEFRRISIEHHKK